MMTVLMTIQILSIIVIFLFTVYMLARHSEDVSSMLTAAVMSSFVGSIGYTMVILSESTDAALAVNTIDVMGAAFSLYFIYCFCSKYCDVTLPGYVGAGLLGLDMIGIVTAMTDSRMHFFFRSFESSFSGLMFIPEVKYNWGFFIISASMAAQSVLIVLFVISGCKKRGFNNFKHSVSICSAAVLPLIAKIISAVKLFGGFDLTSIMMVLSCVLIYFIIYHNRVEDVVTSARNSVIETMDDALLVTDMKMNVVDANSAAKKIFPFLSGQGDDGKGREMIKELIEKPDWTEFDLKDKYYEKRISKIHDDDGNVTGFALLILDVTETREYVNQLIDMQEKADKANNAKSDFLANMSHEIRTPMNAILGFAELCVREQNYTYANDIKAAAKNLITIVNDILDISKIESGKMELVPSVYNTENMLREVVSIIEVQLESKKTVELIADIDKDLPSKMYGDEIKLKQILINLLGNAVKFTKTGSITFAVREVQRTDDKICVGFRIIDTGIGIKQEDISKLFSNFQQVDSMRNREIEGTGLGLSISQKLAALMDGSITVESEYGKGSTFTVVVWQQVSSSESISPNAVFTRKEKEKELTLYAPEARVLVVDDNKVNLNVTSHILSSYGIKPDLADSGRAAIDKINSSYYDLVFMDHMMPGMDGVETTGLIRSQGDAYTSDLPIVALTANAVDGAKEMFLKSGFNDFLSKPIQINRLEEILAEWLPEHMVTYVKAAGKTEETVRDAQMDTLGMLGIIDDSIMEPQENEAPEENYGFSIPGINIGDGLKLCGDMETYMSILKTYSETADECIEKIALFARERDYKNYTIEVHGLKSSSLAVGANELSEMAKQLEMAGKEENYDRITADTPALLAKYTDLLGHIRPVIAAEEKAQSGDSDSADKPPIDKDRFKAGIKSILNALDELDSETALQVFDKLLEYSLPSDSVAAATQKARQYTDNFAYEKAEEILRPMLDALN
ncbi:MAG: response regulator [Oscillospiraceae bacterium]|nr:response regulator [Oscillospiraceae bacterium]